MAAERCEVWRQTIQVGALHEKQPTLLQRRMARRVTEPPQLILNCGQSGEQSVPRVLKIDRRQFASDPECARASAPIELEGYTFLDIVGRGAYGVVHRATCDRTDGEVALKVINTSKEHDFQSAACREWNTLKQMEHPHIVRAFDFHVLTNHTVLVMELFDGVPLSRAVQRAAGKCIAQEETRVLFRALLQALDHIHSRGIVHRDVKPENVLVSEDKVPHFTDLRLIDFNTACISKDITELCASGTELYAAPEVLRGAAPTEANDVWGAGICLHLMLCGRLPSICGEMIESPKEGEPTELRVSGSRWKTVTEFARNAVRRCLALQRSQRPSAAQMLEDIWVSGREDKPATKFTYEKDGALPISKGILDVPRWSKDVCSSRLWPALIMAKASTSESGRVDSKSTSSGTPTSAGLDDFECEWEFAVAY